MKFRSVAAASAVVSAVAALGSPAAPAAHAARLVGGREQAAIANAFRAGSAHRSRVIVSIRASTVAPSWAVVRSVTPQPAGTTTPRAARLNLHNSYFHLVGGAARPGTPRNAVRADLDRDFQVAVVYTGSGGESIAYSRLYRSVCAGAGNFTDVETATVSPMAWSVRYVVDLDDVVAATRSSDGTVLVPAVSFVAGASRLDAVESLSRTVIDTGCNGRPTSFHCQMTFHLGGQDPAAQVSFAAGLAVGLPTTSTAVGACNPDDYTLGPSLWDGGAATALVGRLGLLGGRLPANPYAPVAVAWPESSAQSLGFVVSPCQGAGGACTDTFDWKGTLALRALSAG
ncbi:MAG: hypothetical protein WAL63_10955 [Solirubrobacteraceae bacterium]